SVGSLTGAPSWGSFWVKFPTFSICLARGLGGSMQAKSASLGAAWSRGIERELTSRVSVGLDFGVSRTVLVWPATFDGDDSSARNAPTSEVMMKSGLRTHGVRSAQERRREGAVHKLTSLRLIIKVKVRREQKSLTEIGAERKRVKTFATTQNKPGWRPYRIPKWSYASLVATRPRGVRSRNPICMRKGS